MATSRKPTDLPTPQTESIKSHDTLTPSARIGGYIGLGGAFCAGLAVRHALPRALATSMVLIPSCVALGFFSRSEFDRRDGQRKVAEFKAFGLQQATDAHTFVSEKINSFRK
jgi:hypothetical protein